MQKPAWILFDCMETIVDVVEKPDVRLYCSWCYDGSGLESLWQSFDSFVVDYVQTRETLKTGHERYREFNSLEVYRIMTRLKLSDKQEADTAANRLLNTFWSNYKKNCYVEPAVKDALAELSRQYHCAVVSNFMVDGGIEDLLEIHGMIEYFDFVVTSVRTGWKKPHPKIYDAAMANIQAPKDRILFVGDTCDCDYTGPREYGFNAILLDKENRYPEVSERINTIGELPGWLSRSIDRG